MEYEKTMRSNSKHQYNLHGIHYHLSLHMFRNSSLLRVTARRSDRGEGRILETSSKVTTNHVETKCPRTLRLKKVTGKTRPRAEPFMYRKSIVDGKTDVFSPRYGVATRPINPCYICDSVVIRCLLCSTRYLPLDTG